MTKERTQRIHWLFNALSGIVIIVAGISLIIACVDIYQSGDQPFSREAVSEAFRTIAIPVYLCLTMIFLGFIWDFVSPLSLKSKKSKNSKQYRLIRNHMLQVRDISKCDSKLQDALSDISKKRKISNIITTIIVIISTIIFLIYACNSDNFDRSDINGSIINAMWIMIPCTFIAFFCALYAVISNEKSYQAEIDIFKQIPIAKKNDSTSDSLNLNNENKICSSKKITFIRLVVLIIAVALIAIGYFSDGTADVLTKAINICTECIGLG